MKVQQGTAEGAPEIAVPKKLVAPMMGKEEVKERLPHLKFRR